MSNLKKKILIVSYWNNPVQSAGSNRINSFIKYLQELNWEVVLVSPNYKNPYLVNKRKLFFDTLIQKCDKRYLLNGFSPDVVFKHFIHRRIKVGKPDKKTHHTQKTSFLNSIENMVIRLSHYLFLPDGLFWGWYLPNRNKILRIYDKEQPNIVFTSAMPIACHYFGNRLSRKKGATWVADFRDLYCNNLVEKGIFLNFCKAAFQKQLIKKAHHLTTVSQVLKKDLQKKTKKSVSVIYNGYDYAEPRLHESKSNKIYYGIYTGSLYDSQFRSFKLFLDYYSTCNTLKKVCFIGRHDISYINRILSDPRYIKIKPLFEFHNTVSSDDLHEYVSCSDYYLHFDFEVDGNISSKVFNYLSSNKRLVFFTHNQNSELCSIVTNSGHTVVSEQDIRSKLAAHKIEKDFTRNGSYIEQFHRKFQAKNLSLVLDEL